jgi:hypothetical protein
MSTFPYTDVGDMTRCKRMNSLPPNTDSGVCLWSDESHYSYGSCAVSLPLEARLPAPMTVGGMQIKDTQLPCAGFGQRASGRMVRR